MTRTAPAPRVLLVEDDPAARTALKEALQEEGYQVEVAGDGGEGIRRVSEFRPDVILMDLVLPGLNGFDAAVLLKNQPTTSGIPLLAVTASWLGSDGSRLQRIGFDGALRKPFSLHALLTELRRVLRD
jgi:CheY-like chemotaxis protein